MWLRLTGFHETKTRRTLHLLYTHLQNFEQIYQYLINPVRNEVQKSGVAQNKVCYLRNALQNVQNKVCHLRNALQNVQNKVCDLRTALRNVQNKVCHNVQNKVCHLRNITKCTK